MVEVAEAVHQDAVDAAALAVVDLAVDLEAGAVDHGVVDAVAVGSVVVHQGARRVAVADLGAEGVEEEASEDHSVFPCTCIADFISLLGLRVPMMCDKDQTTIHQVCVYCYRVLYLSHVRWCYKRDYAFKALISAVTILSRSERSCCNFTLYKPTSGGRI